MIEKTLVVLKPDAVKAGLERQIISRYQKAGLHVVKRKEVIPDRKLADNHYAATEPQIVGMGHKTLSSAKELGKFEEMVELFGTDDPRKIGEELREWSLQFISSGKVVAFILEGEDAIKTVRRITGFTDPTKADAGTIRADMSKDSISKANFERRACENLVHASGDPEEAKREIALWFGMEEV
ncbi:MAG: nucleoside-diphosphate kinase [Candidatus Aenigmarchaeota archaeon]|nr:nucleoside-diphosphate kinase [Candidatus Aenigmarchaeota archaeon]